MLTRPSNLAEAIVEMEKAKHWTIKTINRNGARAGYECTLWANGKRVRSQGQSPLAAVQAAMAKLEVKPKLKVFK